MKKFIFSIFLMIVPIGMFAQLKVLTDGPAVYSTETQVVLPSTLSGDYEIELRMGYWKFTGWITLE